MKKRLLAFLISIFIIIIVAMVFIHYNQNKNVLEETSAEAKNEVVEKIPVEWHGKYIWDESSDNNTWMCFRKKVHIEEANLKNVIAQIAVDSKYWLYINGKMVIREGGLKRGQEPDSIYYDEVDLTKYLKKGENTIAILAWYWGGESYSHVVSGQGAMLFQAQIGDNYVISDETWKVSKHESYLQDPLRPNNRLIEYNVYYDAKSDFEDWHKIDFDDTSWQNAKVLGVAGSAPWGKMIERTIPQFKNYKLKEYENMSEYKKYTTTKTEKVEMIIPYNAQFTPYLKIKTTKGKKITIKTDQYADINGDSVMCTYLTKDGVQEFESLAWMNGEKVYYEIPEGVTIISLGYRESGYDSEMTGSFVSDDEFMNKLWKMAARTLYVNMRDSYMDCPNRERAQWLGDMNVEMLEAMYAMDTNANALYEKGVKTIIGWETGGVLLTVVPCSLQAMHLPMQVLGGVATFYDYYLYTGKIEFLEEVYPYAKNYVNLWRITEDNLVDCMSQYYLWEWGDSAEDVDYDALENAFYYLAMNNVYEMANLLGYTEDANNFKVRLETLKTGFNNNLWTEDGYKSKAATHCDERVNAMAVIAGLASEDKYPVIRKMLINQYESSAYMEKYALEALCKMGYIEDAQTRMHKRYNEMVNGKDACSTLWECWDPNFGTKNHAWAGGPLVIMSKYFAGVEPLEEGYDVISIKPQFGKLTKISTNTTTVKGDVKLEAEKTQNSIDIKIDVPAKTRIGIPKIAENIEISLGDKVIYENQSSKKNKKAVYDSEDDQYVYFYVDAGEYDFKVQNM